jgi:hypothetical protein
MKYFLCLFLFLHSILCFTQEDFREIKISYPDSIFNPYENLYYKNHYVIYYDNTSYVGFSMRNIKLFGNLEVLKRLIEAYNIQIHIIQDSIKLKEIAKYENNTRHGKANYYLYDSIEYMNGFYCYGKPCGLFNTFNINIDNNTINNRLGALINFDYNGTQSGFYAAYNISTITTYKTNSRPPKYEYYYINLISQTFTFKNGKRHGPSFEFSSFTESKYGELVGYTLWKDDKVIDGKYLHKDRVHKYKNGRLIANWKYDEDGKLGLNQRRELGYFRYYLNFNKLIYPIKKIRKGKMEYEDYINRKMR